MSIPTLQEALKLDIDGILALKNTLKEKIAKSDLNAYIGELQDYDSNLIPYEINDVGVKYKDIYKAIKNESNS